MTENERMTIDGAIVHAREVSENNRKYAKECEECSNRKIDKLMKLDKMHQRDMQFCIECAEEHEKLAEWLEELKKYRAIGTVDEFKVLKGKNTPMELDEHNFQDEPHHYMCPVCRNIVSSNQNYCEECGQALET